MQKLYHFRPTRWLKAKIKLQGQEKGEKMKAFTWTPEGISAGLQVQADEKLGQIVFLGEAGRGRRYEKIGLARHNSAEILNGRVVEAQPVKITLPAKDGKSEKHFFVLERPKMATHDVLVRVNSYGGYIRGGSGRWQTVVGKPETLVSAYGAFGDAGRIGNWDDGLVVMHPGDVIKIHPSRNWGRGDSALWLNEVSELQTASWQDYETIMAIHEAEAIIANAGGKPIVAGQMPCFSFSSGKITSGIKLEKGVAGMAVRLGEEGRGRKLAEISAIDETATFLTAAAVVDLGKEIFGMIQFEESEPNAYLVRICTRCGYTRRGNGSWQIWKGAPTVITEGHGADGDAGGIGRWADGLLILHEGDVIYVCPSGDGPSYAVFVKNGKVQTETWISWKVEDAKLDPSFYVSKGTAPWGHVPADWVGRIVTTKVMGERCMCGGHMIPTYEERETGELISTEPLILNLGWDGQDRHNVAVNSALWVVLTDKKVRRLEGEEAIKRCLLREEAENLYGQLMAITKQSFFRLAEASLRNNVEELAQPQNFDVMPTAGWYDSLTAWVEKARRIFGEITVVEEGLKALEQRQNSGEVIVYFGGHFRTMGATHNAQYWVIRADGTEREPDEVNYRKRYTFEGEKSWRLVGPEELAISWFKAYTAADHEFIVNKVPQGGCTLEQLMTVKRLEAEISQQFYGSVGVSGRVSPEIGKGWNLGETKPEPVEPTSVENDEGVDLAEVDLSEFFGGCVVR
ncbi:hypothetical protein EOM71_00555 [Candidatus Falkowbacteria bacterium]|nr:hypothetical protein [Candidatus Falkowbacteria bacterium]